VRRAVSALEIALVAEADFYISGIHVCVPFQLLHFFEIRHGPAVYAPILAIADLLSLEVFDVPANRAFLGAFALQHHLALELFVGSIVKGRRVFLNFVEGNLVRFGEVAGMRSPIEEVNRYVQPLGQAKAGGNRVELLFHRLELI
jgi:hypothetical protein